VIWLTPLFQRCCLKALLEKTFQSRRFSYDWIKEELAQTKEAKTARSLQWRAEGERTWRRPRASKAGVIQRAKLQK